MVRSNRLSGLNGRSHSYELIDERLLRRVVFHPGSHKPLQFISQTVRVMDKHR
ncbi:MAG: hypothetical protein M5U34_19795 [Chloroflexi bacterium]|nr:hypothetical protein [Chloroflexota bacterium]